MAASASDLIQEVGFPGTATTLSSPGYTVGDTAITVGSTSNWPTATGVSFAIDRAEIVDGKEVRIEGTYCEFVGVVSSGTSITSVSKTFGTSQNYAAGALTRVYIPVSSTRENRLAQAELAHADQDGTLKAGAVDNTAVIANGVVTTSKLAPGAIDGSVVLQDNSVHRSKIDFSSIGGSYNAGSNGTTASTTYVVIGTSPSVTVTVGPSGIALLSFHSNAWTNTTGGFTRIAVHMTGANTIAAGSDIRTTSVHKHGTDGETELGFTVLMTGLTPGSTTFQLRYSVNTGTGTFAANFVSVLPL